MSPGAPTPASATPGRRRSVRARLGAAGEPAFEIAQTGEKLVEREQGRAPRQTHERHLERHARLTAAHDVVERLREPLEEAREIVELGAAGAVDDVPHLLVGEVEHLA